MHCGSDRSRQSDKPNGAAESMNGVNLSINASMRSGKARSSVMQGERAFVISSLSRAIGFYYSPRSAVQASLHGRRLSLSSGVQVMGSWLLPKSEQLSPTQKFWSAGIGVGIAGLMLFVLTTVWQLWPAAFPFKVERTETSFITASEWHMEQAALYPEAPTARIPYPPGGVWRVLSEGRYKTFCRTIVVNRRFLGDGQSWTQVPIQARVIDLDQNGRAVLTQQTNEVRYAMDGSQYGRRTVFDYAITRPVRLGTYVIDAEAWGCDNGWSGALPPREIPFSWVDMR